MWFWMAENDNAKRNYICALISLSAVRRSKYWAVRRRFSSNIKRFNSSSALPIKLLSTINKQLESGHSAAELVLISLINAMVIKFELDLINQFLND